MFDGLQSPTQSPIGALRSTDWERGKLLFDFDRENLLLVAAKTN